MDFLAPSQLPVPIPQSSHNIHSPALQPIVQLEKLQLQKAPEPSAHPKPTCSAHIWWNSVPIQAVTTEGSRALFYSPREAPLGATMGPMMGERCQVLGKSCENLHQLCTISANYPEPNL